MTQKPPLLLFFILIFLWPTAILLLILAIFVDDPYLAAIRTSLPGAILAISAIGIVVAGSLTSNAKSRRRSGLTLLILWCAIPIALISAMISTALTINDVLTAPEATARAYGQHFIIGYRRIEDVEQLASRGLIGGIFVTRHNILLGADALRAEISHLQDLRRRSNLPPLIVTTDQEGGMVSHLSPPLVVRPSLAELAGLPSAERSTKAQEQGEALGAELANLGITLDFAPVVDLRSKTGSNAFDFNSFISQRAISPNPDIVTEIASAFAAGLNTKGVGATLKHFPGLGRVTADTHHFRAHLTATPDDLAASDWRAFHDTLAKTHSALMVGHVVVDALDPERPASQSKAVVQGLIRRKWNFNGVTITDDLDMGSVFHHDICTGVVNSLNAGIDLLLVSYDGRQYYRLMRCLLNADAKGDINQDTPPHRRP